MPTRAPHGCAQPGCPTPATDRGRCPEHQLPSWHAGQRGRVMPPGWKATRARILRRDGWRCRWPGCFAPADEVHHVEPGVEADELLVSLCAPHHAAITQQQAAAARRGGPPSPAAVEAGPGPAAHGERSPAAVGAADAAGDGRWGVTPSALRAGARNTVAAQRAAGFDLFWSPQVTGNGYAPGQRPGAAPAPSPAATGRSRRPARPAGRPSQPVTSGARAPSAAGDRSPQVTGAGGRSG